MMLTRFLYSTALGLLRAGTPVLSGGSSKFAVGMRGRRSAHETLMEWGREARDPDRPTVWIHAPSVGEGLQARAVMHALQAARPGVQFVFTYFSPSALSVVARMPCEVSAYLPWDLGSVMGPVLDALEPDLVVFTKTEVWPMLVDEAARRGIPTSLVAGTLTERAGRLRAPARRLLGQTWEALDGVFAVGEEDAERFRSLGASRVEVTGDPGIDSAVVRAGAADPESSYLSPFRVDSRPTLVAGSTWPSDESVLIPALERVLDEAPELRLIIAPHEPRDGVVVDLVETLQATLGEARTLLEVERDGVRGVDAVVVDRIGVLAHLYTAADFAYVGGGYHSDGLHSVLEPAAAGIPVVFGPGHDNAPAAAALLAAGGARVAHDAEELARTVLEWVRDKAARDYAGQCAFGYIDAHRGAAERTARLLSDLITP
jgi:3-deoxy-D-manno-octulosonic-acid transferase